MAFTFGAAPAASGAGLFGAATPAFGSSTPAFGSSTPAFGADAPAFGSSTPAFGASSPFSFSAPQSSAAFSSGLFGAPSQPALGASQAASQPFGAGLFGASSPSLFGASTPAAGGLFAAPAGQPASSPFSWGAQQSPQPNVNNALVPFGGAPGAGQPQQQQQQSAVNVRALVTTQGSWIHHSTTWDEIHPEGQKQLLEFERLLTEQRTQCQELDSCTRLQHVQQQDQGDLAATKQALSRVTSRQGVDESAAAAVRERVSDLMQHVHAAVRALQRSSVFLRQVLGAPSQAIPAGVMEQLAGPVTLPSHYLRSAVGRFQEVLVQLEQVVSEHQDVLERRDQREGEGKPSVGDLAGTLYGLQDCLLGVAARLEGTQQQVAGARDAVLRKRREAGKLSNPFQEAELQEAARGVEPNVHRRPAAQPGPAAPAAGQPAATASGANPAGQPAGSGFSFNLGGAAASAPAGGLFSTPNLAASSAAAGGLFASPFGGTSPGITTRSVTRKTANKKRS